MKAEALLGFSFGMFQALLKGVISFSFTGTKIKLLKFLKFRFLVGDGGLVEVLGMNLKLGEQRSLVLIIYVFKSAFVKQIDLHLEKHLLLNVFFMLFFM